MTKSYPFPVPRVRELSGELEIVGCVGPDLSSASSSSAEEDTTVPPVHNQPEIPLIITSDHEESMKHNDKNMSDSPSSNSKLFQFTNKPSRRYTTCSNRMVGNKHGHAIRVTRRTRNNQRLTRRFSMVKNIVVQPSDATQDDVSKARMKLQRKPQV